MNSYDIKKEEYRRLHALARILGMDDAAYRDMLMDRYGVRSSKELHSATRKALIRDLTSQVSIKSKRFNDLKDRQDKATPAQLRAVEAMWNQVTRMETAADKRKALDSFVHRLTGVRLLRWCSKKDIRSLIKAIQAMGALAPDQFNSQNKKEASNG